jgi:uncharacterized cupin superfamily protein
MEKVTIDDVDIQVNPMQVHSVRRPVSQALGTTDFAMNYFELEPGESFSGGIHTHFDQEEVFYVEEGTATFEKADEAGGDREHVEVDAGELIRFEPGEYQTGVNEGDETVVGWALGAPKSRHDWEQIESLIHCRDCGEETGHSVTLNDQGQFDITCKECGHTL